MLQLAQCGNAGYVAHGAINEAIRDRRRQAVDALLDDDLRERLWLRGERRDSHEQTFDDVVLFVLDELATSDPKELVGRVLLDGVELSAFLTLTATLDALVPAAPGTPLYADAVASEKWLDCLAAARTLRDLLNRCAAVSRAERQSSQVATKGGRVRSRRR